jgi:FAD/FMN-containing dehydrogenase
VKHVLRSFNLSLVSGLVLAAISLTFSATGLIHLFTGSSSLIAVMAIAFEAAKVAITIYLIQHFRWRLLPVALSAALVLLSAISSIGIYGTLGRAYNAGRSEVTGLAAKVTALQGSLAALEQDRSRLYAQVEAVPASQGTNRRRILQAIQPQVRQLDKEISDHRRELVTAQQSATVEAHDIGDLRYASELFGVSQDRLAMGIITVLAFLLDPLALMLLLASGVKQRGGTAMPEPVPVPVAPAVTPSFEVSPPQVLTVQNSTLTMPRLRVPQPSRMLRFDPPADGLSAGATTLLNRFRRRSKETSSG